jgi:hypothetical protein
VSRIKGSSAHDTPLVVRAEREKDQADDEYRNPASSRILEGERLTTCGTFGPGPMVGSGRLLI